MDDLIRRQDAIEALIQEFYSNVDDYISEKQAVHAIDSLPSVQSERPSGKWLSHYDYCKRHGYIPSGMMAFWWCDQCEQGVDHTTKFCPHCGAKMLREDNK